MKHSKTLSRLGTCWILALSVISALPVVADESAFACDRTIKAQVVALDQPWMWNRLGAAQPGGIIYALYEDVVKSDGSELPDPWSLSPDGREKLAKDLAGNVRLRDDKRARPLVLRANKRDCLEITFWNLLSPATTKATTKAPRFNLLMRPSIQQANDKLAHLELKGAVQGTSINTRWAGIHATGIELVHSIESDASWVGENPNGLAMPGYIQVYKWYAAEEGTFLIYSPADMEEAEQTQSGLFGAINVEPEGAEWYRSQVTHDDFDQATLSKSDLQEYHRTLEDAAFAQVTPIQAPMIPAALMAMPSTDIRKMALVNRDPDKRSTVDVYVKNENQPGGGQIYSADGQPLIYYHATYKAGSKRSYRQGLPVLQMLQAKPLGNSLYDEPLPNSSSRYVQELQDLGAGIIPKALRDIFATKLKIDLSAGARLTDDFHYSWLIIDKGNAYLVKGIEPKDPKDPQAVWRLQIFNAELELISSDLTAVITGPDAGRFSYSNTSPTFRTNPASPDRRQPYREFTIIYHQASFATQAFAQWANANLQNAMSAGADGFAINYGSAAIGPEIVANRLGVGPMGNVDAVDLKFEEFFLSSWAVGDPAMVVDVPANTPNNFVNSPGAKPQVLAKVPPDSFAAISASQKNQPIPDKNVPPQSDDYAPLSKVHATKAFFPDDPSNVYHSYMDDHVKFRILHAGAGPAHVHHLHAHQWLHSPDSDDGHYLDSQLIIPGSAYTLEIAYGGSGNRNKTVGDSIFHCHFYPHFAEGMWALWRVHDVFEQGTMLDEHGIPVPGVNRALPDGEIERGTPIPAIVPLPTLAMAPMPAKVELTDLSPWFGNPIGQGRRVHVLPEREPDKDAQGNVKKNAKGETLYVDKKDADGKPVYKNPGYPFFIPGVSGHRSPHPPLGFAWLEDPKTGEPILNDGKKIFLDGGLPRHLVLDGTITKEFQTRWDFTKDFVVLDKQGNLQPGGGLQAFKLPEEGTPIELVAMKTHATRTTPSSQPNGDPGNFILNGLPPAPGAPYADPSVTDFGNANIHKRRYQAAVIQLNVVLNKKGWHFPQQRMISLWRDVAATIGAKRQPEPLFFRSNTQDTIQFWHTNLVPNYYQLDDFQVRTPTDVIGQHIHLVKFDVTASDGASNGFNYESGTFSPEEVRERVYAVNEKGGLYGFDPGTGYVNKSAPQEKLEVKKVNDYYPAPDSTVTVNGGVPVVSPAGDSVFGKPPNGEDWNGAQTTVELWAVDPLLNNQGEDRTLRTVFTHDHFSPSTHQQAGLYAGLVVEPEDSLWYLPDGTRMNTRLDGGPTSWHGYIVPKDPRESYREFMLEFQDLQLAYNKGSRTEVSSSIFDPGNDPANPPRASAVFDLAQAHSIPDFQIKAFAAYVVALNGEKLPVGTGSQPENRVGFPELFLEFGVPLSQNAIVKKVKENDWWTITEAQGEKNAGVKYVVRAIHETQIVKGVIVKDLITHMLVYTPDVTPGWSDPAFALNSPTDGANTPGGSGSPNGPPFPDLVSQAQTGTYSLNYRNEPVPLRLEGGATPEQVDPALVFSSIPRADPDLNAQPNPLELVNAQPDDPYTPLLEAYANDKVQVRTLVGAHVQSHAFEIHGVKWLFEPTYKNSGYRNAQLMGLSEHFEMLFDLPPVTFEHSDLKSLPAFADYFYSPSSDIVGLNNGLWGIMRAYGSRKPGIDPLPNNEQPASPGNIDLVEQGYTEAKKTGGPTREFDVTAVTAEAALEGGMLVLNGRDPNNPLFAKDALLFVRTSDLAGGKLKPGVPVEPLILRAAAGEWIKVTVRNGFDLQNAVFQKTYSNNLPYGTPFGAPLPQVAFKTSSNVGLHPQLVAYDPVNANGLIVGFNPVDKLVAPGTSQDFYWYAGKVTSDETGKRIAKAVPIEFGGTNLVGADQLIQPQFGMVGTLIVEPEGSSWAEDISTRAAATVTKRDGARFREFVVVDQNMFANSNSISSESLNNLNPSNEGGVVGAINFRSEPFIFRGSASDAKNLPQPAPQGFSQAFSNSLFNKSPADPVTPVFVAPAGMATRFRLVVPSTSTSNAIGAAPVFIVHGHNWQEEPYTEGSTRIGNNRLSEYLGAIEAGPNQKFDLLFESAGGADKVPGDYLYDTYQTGGSVGTWGVFRVTKEEVVIEKVQLADDSLTASGLVRSVTSNGDGKLPKQLEIYAADASNARIDLGEAEVDAEGNWSFRTTKTDLSKPATIQVTALTENGNTGATAVAEIVR
jgi:hypothetical protein